MRTALFFGLSLFAAACSGGGDDGDETVNCAEEDRDDTYVAGLAKNGQMGKLTFTLVEATPAPPARYDNTWILQLTSVGAAAPVTGAAMIVTPWMPDHQHRSPSAVVVEPLPEAGKYKLEPVNLWMPGFYETTIEAQDGQNVDKAVFKFCIPS